MRDTLEIQLGEKYPKIFVSRRSDMKHTTPCWGFECADGWFNIIDKLCANIQRRIDGSRRARAQALRFNRALNRAQQGNIDPLARYFSGNGDITERSLGTATNCLIKAEYRKVIDAVPQVVAEQVKEKFGGLRFYYRGGDDYVLGLVSMAESMSVVTCETCGNVGKRINANWIYTACDAHTHPDDLPK